MGTIVAYDLEWLCDRYALPEEEIQTIRIGAAKLLESGKIELFDAFVKPLGKAKLSNYCKLLTMIKQEDVNKAKTFPTVFQEFLNWVGNAEETIFYSWGNNDIKQLTQDFKNNKISLKKMGPIKNTIDLQELFKEYSGTQDSVETALSRYGLSFVGKKHNPKFDSYNTLRVWLGMEKRPNHTELIRLKQSVFKSKNLSHLVRIAEVMDKNQHSERSYKTEISRDIKREIQFELLLAQADFDRESLEYKDVKRLHKRLLNIKKRYKHLAEEDIENEMKKINRYLDSAKDYLQREKIAT